MMNKCDQTFTEINVSVPRQTITEKEFVSLLAGHLRERAWGGYCKRYILNDITYDEDKIQFAYEVPEDYLTGGGIDVSKLLTDDVMNRVEAARLECQRAEKGLSRNPMETKHSITELLEIRNQILAVRDSGKYNMFDCPGVQRYAYEAGLYELVLFIEECRRDYVNFIVSGDLAELKMADYPVEGSEIVLEEMKDPYPVEVGTKGIVEGYDGIGDMMVKWENGSGLKLVPGVDRYHVE